MKNDVVPTPRLNMNLTEKDQRRLMALRTAYEAKLGINLKWTDLVRLIIHNHSIPNSISASD